MNDRKSEGERCGKQSDAFIDSSSLVSLTGSHAYGLLKRAMLTLLLFRRKKRWEREKQRREKDRKRGVVARHRRRDGRMDGVQKKVNKKVNGSISQQREPGSMPTACTCGSSIKHEGHHLPPSQCSVWQKEYRTNQHTHRSVTPSISSAGLLHHYGKPLSIPIALSEHCMQYSGVDKLVTWVPRTSRFLVQA